MVLEVVHPAGDVPLVQAGIDRVGHVERFLVDQDLVCAGDVVPGDRLVLDVFLVLLVVDPDVVNHHLGVVVPATEDDLVAVSLAVVGLGNLSTAARRRGSACRAARRWSGRGGSPAGGR